jgi:gas vesicle protein
MADRSGGGEFFAGLVIGGLVGAGIALLMAPQSGEETRAQIRDAGVELKDRANETMAEAREKAEAITADSRRRAEEIMADARKSADKMIADARQKADEIEVADSTEGEPAVGEGEA